MIATENIIINNIYKKWQQEETKRKQEEERKDKIIKNSIFRSGRRKIRFIGMNGF